MRDGETAAMAFIHPGEVAGVFAASLAVSARSHPELTGLMSKQTGPRIAAARNQLVREFLTSGHDWLLMVDGDMKFGPGDTRLVLDAADVDERPVVGGLCFAMQQGVLFPTMYKYADDGETFLSVVLYPPNQLVEVDGTGAAFLLVHRRVFEAVAIAGDADAVHPWFAEAVIGGRERGEDLTFCHRARRLGIPINVHTGARIGHRKDRILTEADYVEQLNSPPLVVTGPPGLPERWLAGLLNGLHTPAEVRALFPLGSMTDPGAMGSSPFRAEISWPAAPNARLAADHGCPVVYVDPGAGAALAQSDTVFTCGPGDEEGLALAALLGEEWPEVAADSPERPVRAAQAHAAFRAMVGDGGIGLDELSDPSGAGLRALLAAAGYTRDLAACAAALGNAGPPPC